MLNCNTEMQMEPKSDFVAIARDITERVRAINDLLVERARATPVEYALEVEPRNTLISHASFTLERVSGKWGVWVREMDTGAGAAVAIAALLMKQDRPSDAALVAPLPIVDAPLELRSQFLNVSERFVAGALGRMEEVARAGESSLAAGDRALHMLNATRPLLARAAAPHPADPLATTAASGAAPIQFHIPAIAKDLHEGMKPLFPRGSDPAGPLKKRRI
jgi:hypothetical protein